jgi:TolB protein
VSAIGGTATFPNLSIDRQAAGYTLTASAPGLTSGTSAEFVASGAPVALAFQNFYALKTIVGYKMRYGPSVVAHDALGNDAAAFDGTVSLSLGANPAGAVLQGTTTRTASGGATGEFNDLLIDRTGTGYILVATANGLSSVTSTPFDVVPATDLIAFVGGLWGIGVVSAANGGVGMVTGGWAPEDRAPGWSPEGAKITFMSNRASGLYDIYVMNADGSDLRRLTSNGCHNGDPDWSPDGLRIAFYSCSGSGVDIYVMQTDGSGVTRITTMGHAGDPSWAPDGRRLAFSTFWDVEVPEVYVMNADGSGTTRLASGQHPAWSPDGTPIAFSNGGDLYTMSPDGSNVVRLSDLASQGLTATQPTWSPDGTRIAFSGVTDFGFNDLYVMNADGSAITPLTLPGRPSHSPAWRPTQP